MFPGGIDHKSDESTITLVPSALLARDSCLGRLEPELGLGHLKYLTGENKFRPVMGRGVKCLQNLIEYMVRKAKEKYLTLVNSQS